MSAQRDDALRLLCKVLEYPDEPISPDAIRYSGEAETFRYLQDLGALAKAEGICRRHLCHWCGAQDLVEVRPHGDAYRGYCTDCGWIELTLEDVTPLCADGGAHRPLAGRWRGPGTRAPLRARRAGPWAVLSPWRGGLPPQVADALLR